MAVDMRHLTSAGELTEGAVAECGSDLTGTLAAAKRQCGRRSPACARPTRCGPWPAGTARSPSAADQREPRRSRCDQAGDHAPWNRLAASQRPSRGVASTTTPNQRPRISQLPARTSTPVSSSRHSCHRSPGCAMPARAARCGRAPASRRAAISVSPGVRTLTTTACADVALDDHHDGEAAVRRAASHLECGAQNAPRGSARLPAGQAPWTTPLSSMDRPQAVALGEGGFVNPKWDLSHRGLQR